MKMRVCTKCGGEKPETAEYFSRAKNCRGGINTACKECNNKRSREWKAKNPEKVKEARKRWQAKNPEKVKEAVKRWQAKNPEKVKDANKRWIVENPEKVIEYKRKYNRKWYVENTEKVKERMKRWQAENHEKVRESRRRYRNELAPDYLKSLISAKYDIDRSEIGDELIAAKRREMKYYRQFKQLNQLKK